MAENSNLDIFSEKEKLQKLLEEEISKNRQLTRDLERNKKELVDREEKIAAHESHKTLISDALKGQIVFQHVISFLTEDKYKVLPSEESHIEIVKNIAEKALLNERDENGSYNRFKGKRVNEMSQYMEGVIRKCFKDGKLEILAKIPRNAKGEKQSSGYPDLEISIVDEKDILFYLEIKVFGKGKLGQTFRTFYVSSANKIRKTCSHIMLGFEHEDMTLTGKYFITDMYNKKFKLKQEFSTCNKILYDGKEHGVK